MSSIRLHHALLAVVALQSACGPQTKQATPPDFATLSRPITSGPIAGTRQMLFAIDREAKPGSRVHWIDTNRYPLHVDWFGPQALMFGGISGFTEENYRRSDRRWILGSVVSHPENGRYSVELWEGDTADAIIVTETMRELGSSFGHPLTFTPTSDALDAAAMTARVEILPTDEAYALRPIEIMRPGRAVGTLRIVDDASQDFLPTDVVILRRTPVFLDPVAGVITMSGGSPLSHVAMLADQWRIPHAMVRDAGERWSDLEGVAVVMEAGNGRVTIRRATHEDIRNAEIVRSATSPKVPTADLAYKNLPSLTEATRSDSVRIGAKAANLAEVASTAAASKNLYSVPPGFSVPFAHYDDFVRANGLDRLIASILSDPTMRTDRAYARRRLAALRIAFAEGRFDPALLDRLETRWRAVIGKHGVFVRSSTNSEDLPGFNGAGLYTSVPNVMTHAALADAVRTVWGSLWNDRAFFARQAAGIDHKEVRASVLIQKAMASDSSGVLVTAEPGGTFGDPDAVTINAKRGLGEQVVEGAAEAERLIYRTSPIETVRVLARSHDGKALALDPEGGTRALDIVPGNPVLTYSQTVQLGRAGNIIKKRFRSPQDVEWLFVGGQLWIVQSRPWLGTH
jgi:hypothetical protein